MNNEQKKPLTQRQKRQKRLALLFPIGLVSLLVMCLALGVFLSFVEKGTP